MSAAKLKVKTNSLPNSRLAVEVEIPSERCKKSFEEAISRLSRSVRIPGFRQGKVPRAVILQQVGSERVQASALETLLQRAWEEAIQQEKIEPLCEPELNDGFESLLSNFNPEKPLKISLSTDIAPNPTLKSTKGLTAEVETIEFKPEKIDDLIEESRKQLATLVPISNRAAKSGDIAVVNFKGHFADDGSEIEGGSGEAMEIELKAGQMIPGFTEGIVGMKINEEKTLECKFPEKYHQEDAQGRQANFIVNLKDLKERELPKLDDAFAQQASDKKTMVELRADLEERLKEDAKRRDIKNRNDGLLNCLVEQLEVEMPKSLIDLEVKNIVEQTAQNFAQQGIDVKSMFTEELVKSLMESSRPEAEEKLRKKLALEALAKAESIEVDDKELEEKLKEVKDQLAKEKNIDQQRLRQVVLDDLLEEKLFDWLTTNNTVKIKEKTTESSPKTKGKKKEAKPKSAQVKPTKTPKN